MVQNNSNDIKLELEKSSSRYHILGAWIAVFFNPLFAVTDYINIPEDWVHIMYIRIIVSVTTLVMLFMYKKRDWPSYIIVLVPFLLISLQNAYTFQFIDNEHILGHTLNYLALFFAAGLFILWQLKYSILVISTSILLTTISISLNENIKINIFLVEGGILLLMGTLLSIVLIQARYRLTIKEIIAQLKLRESNKKLENQTKEVQEKNQHITQSINYAKRIQDSILGSEDSIHSLFPNSFIIYKPKDILSGDFYYHYECKTSCTKIVVTADCTGHGVPAALMTVLGINSLKEIIEINAIHDPEKILSFLDIKIKESLSKSEKNVKINDGMDASIVVIKETSIAFSGAFNPIFIVKKTGETKRIKGTRNAIGGENNLCNLYAKINLDLTTGDKIYLFSDGFQDQYGGPNFKKFMSKTFRENLLETSTLSMDRQKQELENRLRKWQGNAEQTDDILVVGIEI